MFDDLSYLKVVKLSKRDYYTLITTLAVTHTLTARRITKRLLNIIRKIIPEKISRIETYVYARRELPLKKLVKDNDVHLLDITTADNRRYEIHVHCVDIDEDNNFVLYVTAIRRA